jgi:hypothetical protein
MLANYISRTALFYAGVRLGLALLTLYAVWRLFRRPRPERALLLIVASHLVAALATLVPLQRPYALSESTDRSFNLGMAARVSLGGSPFEHTQVGFASPEPFTNVLVATLALFDVERVAAAAAALTPIALVAFALLLYKGLAPDGVTAPGDADAWERVMLVFAALSLSSLSMNPRPPTPPFWAGNFLLKPNHGAALGLVALAAGLLARQRQRPLLLGLVLGGTAWVFLLDWAYALPGLALGALLFPRGERRLRPLGVATALSALIALPYVLHLLPDYSPAESHGAAQHMWGDPRGLPLAGPNWSTLDFGPLLVLAVLGAGVLRGRGAPRDRMLLGLLLASAALVLLSMPAALFGIAPEPDELHYFLRFCASLAAGSALAAGARSLEAARSWQPGQGHVVALALFLPLSFPIYWDPPSMDRYFALSRQRLRPKVQAYAEYIRENVPRDAVFLAGKDAASWIPALTGRRVVLAEGGRLMPPDRDERKGVERALLLSDDPAKLRGAALRYGVTHIAIDDAFVQEYGVAGFEDLAKGPLFKTLFANSAARIVALELP